jgi:predicted transcriptional regulator
MLFHEQKEITMTRSQLETYVEITSLLAQTGPLKLTQIMFNINLNFSDLKENLSVLVKQAFVEKRAIAKGRVIYAVTQRGINVLNYFQVPKQTIPIIPIESQVAHILLSNYGFSGVQEQLYDFS